MNARKLGILGLLVAVAGCQSSYTYERIGYGPTLEVSEAQCRIMATGTQQQVIAWGSASYVAGAQLGNAIGNAIREDAFMRDCMILQGWKRQPVTTSQVQTASQSAALQRRTQERYRNADRAVANAKAKGQRFPKAPKPYGQ